VEAGRWQAESISAPSSKITKMRPIFLGMVILQSFIQMLKIKVQALCQRREEKNRQACAAGIAKLWCGLG